MARHDHSHGKHGNPEDVDSYIARMEEPERAEWQKPVEVLKALGLAPGQVVCDIGAGPGSFARRGARLLRAAGGADRGAGLRSRRGAAHLASAAEADRKIRPAQRHSGPRA